MPNAGKNADVYAPFLDAGCKKYGIDTPTRVAAFLANVAVESGELSRVTESLYYSTPERIAAVWPTRFTVEVAKQYVKQPQLLAEKVYGGRFNNPPGKSFSYIGHGLIQITGLDSHRAAGEAMGIDLVAHPELLTTPQYAAESAAWFFSKNCNELADKNFDSVCRRVNGGTNGLTERRLFYSRALITLGA